MPAYRAGRLAGAASRFRAVAAALRGLILNAFAEVNVNGFGRQEYASWDAALRSNDPERDAVMAVRMLAGQALTRAAGVPLRAGNLVRLLKDARELPRLAGSTVAARSGLTRVSNGLLLFSRSQPA